LDSLSTIGEIINKTKENGLPGVAITDHGNMNSYGHFYLEAKEAGIKPIIGIESYFLPSVKKWKEKMEEIKLDENINTKERKEKVKEISKRYHLILLAKNLTGFKNLNLLVHESYKNFYYRPRIDRNLLKKYSEGLICSSACIGGELQQAILNNKPVKHLNKIIGFYKDVFGEDYYLEIQINEMKDQKYVNEVVLQLAKKHKIKTILTGDSHYTNSEDQKTHQTLLLMNSKSTYEDLKNKQLGDMNSGAWEFDTKRLYLKNYEEYNLDRLEFNPEISKKQFDEMCENTFDVFEKIENYEIDSSVKLKDVNPQEKDKPRRLKSKCIKKLKEIKLYDNKEYVDRLKFELGVIKKKELENYFFIVKSIVDHAIHNMKMYVGPGRGSASGSLVSYLLGITQIDPLRYNLYFERFLDVERYDYADIDIDFEDNDKIKEWVLDMYKDESACISSYSTFHLFGLVKDLGRTYGIEDAQYWNSITKQIRKDLKAVEKENDLKINEISYEDAELFSETFRDVCQKYKLLSRDMKILMGKYRHIGRHAAGLIISEDLLKNQPIMILKGQNQTSLTEGMQDQTLSKFGFIKIDILGLKTLKVMHETIKIISERQKKAEKNIYSEIDPDKIDLKLKNVYQTINNRNVSGIFQFDTESALQAVDKVNPEEFDDLVAINALNRPGPKQFIELYADRKHGTKETKYKHQLLGKILKNTYGIIVYQEQVMEIAKQMAGYTLAEANNLRKAIGKKIESLMLEHEEKFINGCIKNKISDKLAKSLYDKIKEFAKYSFNKAHACAYAMISYQCAYLKTHYPIEFYTALLKVETKEEKIDKIIKEVKKTDIKVKPLNIIKSDKKFKIIGNSIYYGFNNIKGIGEKAADTIIEARSKKSMKTFKDFLLNEHINRRVCNKRIVEILLQSFVFGKKFEDKLEFFKWFQEARNKQKKKTLEEIYKITKEGFLYLRDSKELNIEYLTENEKVKLEKSLYGTNLSMSCFEIDDRDRKVKKLLASKKSGGFKNKFEYSTVQFKNIILRKDKNGNEMSFLDLEDINGEVKRGIIFSSNFDKDKVKEGNVYCIKGNIQDSFLIDSYKNIDNLFKDK
jgi:DNA polymerase-3 subunit alpha